jgi:hypothetical protein
VAGGWWLAAGGWRLVAGGWRLAAGGWRLVAGGWRLVAGGWRLAAGGWWLVAGAVLNGIHLPILTLPMQIGSGRQLPASFRLSYNGRWKIFKC